MKLQKALEIQPGVTAIIGGGGKTTLMECLAEELSAQARVIVCTTTHIYPEQNMPCLVSTSEAEIAAELARTRCVCVGSVSESGKYSAPELPFFRRRRTRPFWSWAHLASADRCAKAFTARRSPRRRSA